MRVRPLALAASIVAAPVWAQQPEPLGSEFRVNSYTTGSQTFPAVTTSPNGGFVVVWGSAYDVIARRFDSAGSPIGAGFAVNTYTSGTQTLPRVGMDAGGNFVVVWESAGQDGSGYGVFGRRFDAAGNPLGAEIQITVFTNSNQLRPVIATNANGSFVVAWQSAALDGSGYGVFARRFDPAGAALGGEFQVNTYTTFIQQRPSIGADASGNFVVAWQSQNGGAGDDVFARRFDSGGNPLSPELAVNSYTTGIQGTAAVAVDASGSFVVVWGSVGQDGSSYGVFGRRFDSGGAALGSEFRVNAFTTMAQQSPSVAADPGGGFVVVWASDTQDGNSSGVFARRFDSGGNPLGPEFRVNSYTTSSQALPAIATASGGEFVVAWDSFLQDGSLDGVFGQRFGPPDLIFPDGFESGNLGKWSSAVTDGTNLRATVAAAMAGTAFGLEALVNDTNSLYVQDNNPDAEKRYRARFYLDPNGFDPGEASSHFRIRIFIAFDPSGFRVATVVLKRQAGAYSVEGRVRRNDGTRADTGFFPITDAPHFIELDWQRSTGPGAADGAFEMWIDNTSVATLPGIDNDTSPIDFARLGAIAVKTGASGTLYYDQFESRRRTFIGP